MNSPSLSSLLLSLLVGACGFEAETAVDWSAGPGLKTRWADQVDPRAPLPEYPRPQLVRDEWKNLNGLWELAVVPDPGDRPLEYPDRILVPFPLESSLSGLARRVAPRERVWYRRFFTLPGPTGADPTAEETWRWLLHFGGVDWEAEVFVDGTSVGTHRGGYDPFSFDITNALGEGARHELVVAVRDPTDEGDQPRGKQVLDPHGIWYTAVTGIWQTVWLEPVPDPYITSLLVRPWLELNGVQVRVEASGAAEGMGVSVGVLREGAEVASAQGLVGESISLAIPEPRPWSPADPFLYDLVVRLTPGPVDEVSSYFGLRSMALGTDDKGLSRILLNGAPLFQYGLLDQGWWPDGLYTAPTDEALRFDIVKSRELGFNLIRKHVKVEPARWYYHADREGMLVWQDMPSGDNTTEGSRRQFAQELRRVVEALQNHPSIVMWVPFNEGWGQHDTEHTTGWLKAHDPTRLVNSASGWTDEGGGDVLDVHRYPGPGAPDVEDLPRRASPPRRHPEGLPRFPENRVPVLGEFGGLGLPLPGHTWLEEENWGYRSYENLEDLNRAYQDLLLQLRPLQGEGLAAAIYTQTTDVEIEVNGVLTYDREVVKLSEESVARNRTLFDPPPTLQEIVPTSRRVGQNWRYLEKAPPDEWTDVGFDDSSWTVGVGGFGTEGTPGARIGTVWQTPDLWLRRTFSLAETQASRLQDARLFFRVHHDEDGEVYLNGVRVLDLEGYSTDYRLSPLDSEVAGLLVEGRNTLAIHVHQTDGGQYFDLGIVEWVETLSGTVPGSGSDSPPV